MLNIHKLGKPILSAWKGGAKEYKLGNIEYRIKQCDEKLEHNFFKPIFSIVCVLNV